MTEDQQWTPPRTYDLHSVLETRRLGEISLGAPEGAIETELGSPEYPVARAGRRSKVRVWKYGNVLISVSEEKSVSSISIDFEGPAVRVVEAGELAAWRLPEWSAYSERRGWSARWMLDVLNLFGTNTIVSLSSTGLLHVVGIQRLRPSSSLPAQ